MTYEEFVNFVQSKCMHETIYEDSEGRSILVINLFHAYYMANKAIKEEREACAKLCDGLADMHSKMNQWGSHKTADTLAQAIRARGQA
jgi:hypothetical protein